LLFCVVVEFYIFKFRIILSGGYIGIFFFFFFFFFFFC